MIRKVFEMKERGKMNSRVSKLLTGILAMLMVFAMMPAGISVAYAEDKVEPAPSKLSYEFDGVKYVNNGDGKFDVDQTEYYRAMLQNPYGKNGESITNGDYSVADL